MVKIYTMVKDECDIVKDWILYHGYLFGYENIYVIDNYSTDGTFEIINEFKDYINIFRETDYKLKGDYMTFYIKKYSLLNELSFPIDIDEFVVYYEKSNGIINTDKKIILNYIKNLPMTDLYKMNYIIVNPIDEKGHLHATIENNSGIYSDYGKLAKSFINMKLYNKSIDHGNHIFSNNYLLTDLCLLHFHERNFEQIKKKVQNNCVGLGYQINIDSLKKLSQNISGYHHVKKMILILENRYKLDCNLSTVNNIDITNFNNKIKELIYDYEHFDYKKYIEKYDDLLKNNINNKKNAWIHWNNHGKNENRQFE